MWAKRSTCATGCVRISMAPPSTIAGRASWCSTICDIEWIVVGSELEALILEMNLIKKHRPHYNVRLKDDKRYPYIKVHWADPFPTVTVTRQMVHDGSRYFGPYTSVWAVHQTLDVLRRIFPFLTCDREITGQDERACLYYDIKLCSAPCIGAIDQANYRQMIDDLCQFLEGRTESVVNRACERRWNRLPKNCASSKRLTLRDQIHCHRECGRAPEGDFHATISIRMCWRWRVRMATPVCRCSSSAAAS